MNTMFQRHLSYRQLYDNHNVRSECRTANERTTIMNWQIINCTQRIPLWDTRHGGYITLVSVLVVGAVGVAISTSLLLLGLGSSRTSFAVEQSRPAQALANACSEEALKQISMSAPFTGSGNVVLGKGACSYTVTIQGGHNRIITAVGTVGTIVRKVKIIIDQIVPAIQVVSWQEVADF